MKSLLLIQAFTLSLDLTGSCQIGLCNALPHGSPRRRTHMQWTQYIHAFCFRHRRPEIESLALPRLCILPSAGCWYAPYSLNCDKNAVWGKVGHRLIDGMPSLRPQSRPEEEIPRSCSSHPHRAVEPLMLRLKKRRAVQRSQGQDSRKQV